MLVTLHLRTPAASRLRRGALVGLTASPPLGYLDMLRLATAALAPTNSGGLQKEAYFHRVLCVRYAKDTID